MPCYQVRMRTDVTNVFDHPDATLRFFFSGFGWMKQMPPVNFQQYQQQMDGVYYS
jgi:hypothetical protein